MLLLLHLLGRRRRLLDPAVSAPDQQLQLWLLGLALHLLTSTFLTPAWQLQRQQCRLKLLLLLLLPRGHVAVCHQAAAVRVAAVWVGMKAMMQHAPVRWLLHSQPPLTAQAQAAAAAVRSLAVMTPVSLHPATHHLMSHLMSHPRLQTHHPVSQHVTAAMAVRVTGRQMQRLGAQQVLLLLLLLLGLCGSQWLAGSGVMAQGRPHRLLLLLFYLPQLPAAVMVTAAAVRSQAVMIHLPVSHHQVTHPLLMSHLRVSLQMRAATVVAVRVGDRRLHSVGA